MTFIFWIQTVVFLRTEGIVTTVGIRFWPYSWGYSLGLGFTLGSCCWQGIHPTQNERGLESAPEHHWRIFIDWLSISIGYSGATKLGALVTRPATRPKSKIPH
ncbi:MAG: hypothetical protein U0176_20440 [Bacteroidia bacterium]